MFEGSNMIEQSCAPQSKYTVHACSCPYSSNQHVEIQNPYSQGKNRRIMYYFLFVFGFTSCGNMPD